MLLELRFESGPNKSMLNACSDLTGHEKPSENLNIAFQKAKWAIWKSFLIQSDESDSPPAKASAVGGPTGRTGVSDGSWVFMTQWVLSGQETIVQSQMGIPDGWTKLIPELPLSWNRSSLMAIPHLDRESLYDSNLFFCSSWQMMDSGCFSTKIEAWAIKCKLFQSQVFKCRLYWTCENRLRYLLKTFEWIVVELQKFIPFNEPVYMCW